LERCGWDIVLSDYSVPGFGGLQAAELLHRFGGDIPFVLVTGTIGDEGAAAALRAGVTDYVPKNQLERLGPAVRRALDEVRERRRRRELEEQLRQAQKMEAVGQLTGGIAHDFNNILTIMMASAELVGMALQPGQQAPREDLRALLEAGERGRDMIRKLLGFSRRQPLEPAAIDVEAFLRPLTQTLQRLLPASITVRLDVAAGVPAIQADAGSLQQMILNLATNARDAMPQGGTLTIAAAAAAADDPFLARHGAEGEPFVRIAAVDTGTGMSAQVLRHVFEPFFTTKPVEQGTGLGMAMVYGLAKQQQGFVDVISAIGRGTTVALYLPVAPPDLRAAPAREPARAPQAAPRGGALILVADDEPVLRRVMERVLAGRGYRVLTASTGGEALSRLLAHKDELALVVTDQMMPGFSGADLYREARANGLTVPFLVTSGFSPEETNAKGFDPEVPRLLKPWTVDELVGMVAAVLARPGRR
jgi:signal transduction histidine kinase